MKNITSLKIAAQAFTLRNLIQLYQLCHTGSHELYIYSKKTMCKIKDIIELETFRMAHKEQEYLIVVEGKKAVQLIDKFKNIIEPSQKEAH
ncbi:hypothetical protein AXI59_11280 [Bacillus nakamurai]|uniref:General stress protein n=1 Tax=Bacillus nakamurai TaxID=1793963 RepID=A0A150F4B9_9BACI|nr:hypothetical protein [Bacillus nakamurai]KXZ17033.1 hypothetical protein AXI58_01150 [Bacillus nakamurai]KXZ22923.1 hypothetical protein AXI59_11280 [Bacillus nakamurai]MCC9024331.1 hypothetical protein [Bacillus nakamurai]MCP6680899.1 hypothetical protein [Bacillus nakamurai]MED1229024.1 hypothetical protein [Bacillus nakamurai]